MSGVGADIGHFRGINFIAFDLCRKKRIDQARFHGETRILNT